MRQADGVCGPLMRRVKSFFVRGVVLKAAFVKKVLGRRETMAFAVICRSAICRST
jgi:hypothetical protein